MNLGLFVMPLHPPERVLADTLEEDLELLVEADRLGYAEAWIGEHQTLAWEPIPAPDISSAKPRSRPVPTRCAARWPGGSGTGSSP